MIRCSAFLLLLAASACAQDTSKYPSLALRPIETRTDDAPDPDATPAPVAADAALDARIAMLDAAVGGNAADFTTGATKAEAAAKVRGARTVGGGAWVAAQASLADLEALRGDLLGLVSDAERTASDRAQAGSPPYPALDAAQARAQTQLDAETARIVAIKASLGEN